MESLVDRVIASVMAERALAPTSDADALGLVNRVVRAAGLDPDGPLVPMMPAWYANDARRAAAVAETERRLDRDQALARAIRYT